MTLNDQLERAAQSLAAQLRNRLEADAWVMFDDMIADGAAPEHAASESAKFCTMAEARNQQCVAIFRQSIKGADWDTIDARMADMRQRFDALSEGDGNGTPGSGDWRRLS